MSQTAAGTAPTGRTSCALVARELAEPLAGTAARATGWICVERPGPWTPKAPTAVELGSEAARLGAVEDVRLQLIRTVRLAHTGEPVAPVALDGPRTVLLSHASVEVDRRWTRRLRLDHIRELAEVDPRWTLSPTPPPVGEPVDHDVWLLCAHARRDACCALYGRPVAMALLRAGVEVWETTHTGGHRFAATGVVLPDGLSLGRLDSVDPVEVASALTSGSLPTALLRGRCAVPGPAQAAEVALRSHLAVSGRNDVLPIAWEQTADGHDDTPTVTQVHLTAAGAPWTAEVHSAPVTQPRPVSDTATPTHPVTHTVQTLTPG